MPWLSWAVLHPAPLVGACRCPGVSSFVCVDNALGTLDSTGLASQILERRWDPMTYLSINGEELYSEVAGAGDPVLLLHGGFCSLE